MEHLFSTNLSINNREVNYDVVFDHEKYIFRAQAGNKEFGTFSFKREHDGWIDQQSLPEEIKEQAMEALERYLLKQH